MILYNSQRMSEFYRLFNKLKSESSLLNLHNKSKYIPEAAAKTIHQNYKQILIPEGLHLKQEQKGLIQGLIYLNPQKKTFQYERELLLILWFVTQVLFWLHVIHIWPSAAAYPIKPPSWKNRPISAKPEVKDYIIEPDWSTYGKS